MNLRKYSFFSFNIILLLSLFTFCKESTNEIEKRYLQKAVYGLTDNVSWIVILPGLGCNGCIQEGEIFMRDNIKKTEVLFVLTKISSLKILEQKTGIKLKEHTNILIDRENKFSVPTDNGIYPCIIKINDNKIDTHEFQCPKNSMAFRKLKNQISL